MQGGDPAEATRRLQALHPDKHELIGAFYGRFDEMCAHPFPEMAALVEKLHAAGTPLYLLSNAPDLLDPWLRGPARQRHPFLGLSATTWSRAWSAIPSPTARSTTLPAAPAASRRARPCSSTTCWRTRRRPCRRHGRHPPPVGRRDDRRGTRLDCLPRPRQDHRVSPLPSSRREREARKGPAQALWRDRTWWPVPVAFLPGSKEFHQRGCRKVAASPPAPTRLVGSESVQAEEADQPPDAAGVTNPPGGAGRRACCLPPKPQRPSSLSD